VIIASDHGTSCLGINGTGPEYNDSTEALKKYQSMKASLEFIKRKVEAINLLGGRFFPWKARISSSNSQLTNFGKYATS